MNSAQNLPPSEFAAASGRHRHYADFYFPGHRPLADAPVVVVIGNCQAESLRIVLSATGVESLRIPPVHEWTGEDMPYAARALGAADIVVTQPIHAGYRGLPIGGEKTWELVREDAQRVIVPVLRFDGLHPFDAIIRPPFDPSLNPPVVPYHDLRVLARAAGKEVPEPSAATLRQLAAMSVEQMARRENAHGAVRFSPYLESAPRWHTINHPDNDSLRHLGQLVADECGLGQVALPDRELLRGLDSPVYRPAAEALGVADALDQAGRLEPTAEWLRDGAPIDRDIAAAQLEFYREYPDVVPAGLQRHADRLRVLGVE